MITLIDTQAELVVTGDRDVILIVGGASVPMGKIEPHKVVMIAHLADQSRKQAEVSEADARQSLIELESHEPDCSCVRIDVDRDDPRGCELHDPQSWWNRERDRMKAAC